MAKTNLQLTEGQTKTILQVVGMCSITDTEALVESISKETPQEFEDRFNGQSVQAVARVMDSVLFTVFKQAQECDLLVNGNGYNNEYLKGVLYDGLILQDYDGKRGIFSNGVMQDIYGNYIRSIDTLTKDLTNHAGEQIITQIYTPQMELIWDYTSNSPAYILNKIKNTVQWEAEQEQLIKQVAAQILKEFTVTEKQEGDK